MEVSIPQAEKERLIALGYEGMLREMADGKHCQPTSPYRDAVDALLVSVKATEDAAALSRAEEREDRMLSISADSLSLARASAEAAARASEAAFEQARWAKWAAIIAVIAAIISTKDQILALIFTTP